MTPEQENPQGEGGWTKIDEGWRQGLGRTLIGPSGTIREEVVFFEGGGHHTQKDILPGGDLIRIISKENLLVNDPEALSRAPFVDGHVRRIKIIDNKTKTILVMLSVPKGVGEVEERAISFTKGILDADETPFYFNFGRYCAVEGEAIYSEGDINSISIESKIDNPGGGPVIVHDDIGMKSITPNILVGFEENGKASSVVRDVIAGWLARGGLEFSLDSQNKMVSNSFGYMNINCQVEDIGDKFILEMTDTSTKKTIKIAVAKKVDIDGLFSTASIPEFIGWETSLKHVDKYFTVEKDS